MSSKQTRAEGFDPFALTVNDFDKLGGNHRFSPEYEARKRALIARAAAGGAAQPANTAPQPASADEGRRMEGSAAQDATGTRAPRKARRRFTWKVAAAVAAACIALPAGAFAATQIIAQLNVNQDGSSLTLDATGEGGSLGTLAASQATPVKLALPQLDGYTLSDEGKTTYDWKDGFEAGRDMTLMLVQLDCDLQAQRLVTDVDNWEERDLGGTRCIYAKLGGIAGSQYNGEDATGFGQRAYLLFEDAGYMLEAFAQDALPKDEFLGYLAQFKLEACDEADASPYSTASLLLETAWAEGEIVPAPAYDTSQVVPIGQTVDFWDAQYTIEKVNVTDDVQDILNAGGAGMDEERFAALQQAADAGGKLKPYDREHLTFGDGITAPTMAVDSTQTANLKLVYVDVRVKNTGDEADMVQVGCDLSYLLAAGEDKLVADGGFYAFNRPDAVVNLMLDDSPQWFAETAGGKSFYFAQLAKGEEKVFHLGYFVDEDLLDSAYFTLGYNDDAARLVKLV